jgi:hypothetical protein
MKKGIAALIISFIISCFIYTAMANEQTAVESVGEINAKDNSTGTVIAGTTADLVITIIVDMSQAEPGEEIAAIQIIVPSGFDARQDAVKSLTIGGSDIPDFTSVVDRNRIIISFGTDETGFPKLITLTSTVAIEFSVDTPTTPVANRSFIVSLLNVEQNPILVSITQGNADGRINNDSLAVRVVAATKPEPPSGVQVQPDPGGENDLIISWTQSDDPLVSGYLIYRSDKLDEPVADVTSREQTSYTDRGLEPGREFSYTVRSYKTQVLRSDASNISSAVVPEDTRDPVPPVVVPELMITDKGVEITWEASISRDVVRYVIYRGPSVDSLEPIDEVGTDATSYTDEMPPTTGSYLYVIAAVDDSGREAKSSPTQFRQALSGAEPQPNPFTPLSGDARFNQVTFPVAIVEAGEGTFAVKIFDLEGDLIFEKEAEEGSKEIRWDGKDADGEYVDSGVYVYQATVGDKHRIGTVVVAK